MKPLVIDSSKKPQAIQHDWDQIQNPNSFIQGIITQGIGDEDSIDIAALSASVSGMPTIFARANMFDIALRNIKNSDQNNKGLMKFYESLISEWRGFISCLALNAARIRVKRVYLTYSDNKQVSETSNIYEVKGSLGNMLFDRSAKWADPKDDKQRPFLDLIFLTKNDNSEELIGSTSPDSLFFTSASYNLKEETAIYLNEKGVFIDPLKLKKLDKNELNTIYSYAKRLEQGMDDFIKHFAEVPNVKSEEFSFIKDGLRNWISDIQDKSKEFRYEFDQDMTPEITDFQVPFNLVANHSTQIAAIDGVIVDPNIEGAVPFNVNELLLPKETKIACVDINDDKDFLKKTPLLLLKSKVEGDQDDFRYFMLPISPKAIQVFGSELSSVIGLNDTQSSNESKLSGLYNPETQTLSVEISVISGGKIHGKDTRLYSVLDDDLMAKDILVWPNFVSKQWNKYYWFSEMPHTNINDWQAYPFCGDNDSRNIEIDQNGNIKLATDKGNSDIHIEYDPTKLTGAGRNYAYEIFESRNPFRGFMLMYRQQLAGYAVITYAQESPSNIISIDDKSVKLEEANLGVDFGSTNSAVAYSKGDIDSGTAVGYQFSNRRVSLLCANTSEHSFTAGEEEVFFFQNDEIKSNAIKSILALHDNKRIFDDEGQNNIASLSMQAIKGGFPCFEKNLPIFDSKPEEILVKFRKVGDAKLINNMKWDSDNTSSVMKKAYRSAYLKGLILQVYSDLFAKDLYPKQLKWAYPSALPEDEIGGYEDIWKSLAEEDNNPLIGPEYKLEVHSRQTRVKVTGADSSNVFGSLESDMATDSDSWNTGSDDSWNTGSDDSWSSGSEIKDSNDNKSSWSVEEEEEEVINSKDIVINNDPIEFKFTPVKKNEALTEAEAVANFLIGTESGADTDTFGNLVVCFDIGGSTTDISVITKMKTKNSGPAGEDVIVKQSSVRFAAQRIAQATKFSKEFKGVLINVLNKKGVKLDGINRGEDKYSPNTAPYYFEQLVDRLDENEFDEFYKSLAVSCKDLVSVNLYVTGLIMFYAGQITKKAIIEICKSSSNLSGREKFNPQIVFTGKGSRIMDWITAINPKGGREYYLQQFVNGFGGMEIAGKYIGDKPEIHEFRKPEDIKFEVAKGLATSVRKLYTQQNQQGLEVFGEDGFMLLTSNGGQIKFNADDTITEELMSQMGSTLQFKPENPNMPCPKFMKFASLFYTIAATNFKLKITKDEFSEGFRQMNIASKITLLPEYKRARKGMTTSGTFNFVSPIIILEGIKFLEDVILPKMNR